MGVAMKITSPVFEEFEAHEVQVGSCLLKVQQHACELIVESGKRYNITTKESDVLKTLVTNLGKVVSKDALIRAAWGNPEIIGSNSLPVAISNLRKVLEPEKIKIVNVPRQGYQLEVECMASEEPHSEQVEEATEQVVASKPERNISKRIETNTNKISVFCAWLSLLYVVFVASYFSFSWVQVDCEVVGQSKVCAIRGDVDSEVKAEQGSSIFVSSNGKRYEGAYHD